MNPPHSAIIPIMYWLYGTLMDAVQSLYWSVSEESLPLQVPDRAPAAKATGPDNDS